MQTLAKNTNRWSREFVSVATVFEGLAYIHNEDAVTMLQEGLTITNQKMETIERKSAYTAKDGDDMHAYSYIRESIISALAHNNDPHALAVLTQELEIVTNQIVDYKEANKRVFEVNHTTNLLEIVRALMAKADGRAA